MFVCANTLGGPVSPQLKVPGTALSHEIPKFTIDEAALQLCHYTYQVTHVRMDIGMSVLWTDVINLAFVYLPVQAVSLVHDICVLLNLQQVV